MCKFLTSGSSFQSFLNFQNIIQQILISLLLPHSTKISKNCPVSADAVFLVAVLSKEISSIWIKQFIISLIKWIFLNKIQLLFGIVLCFRIEKDDPLFLKLAQAAKKILLFFSKSWHLSYFCLSEIELPHEIGVTWLGVTLGNFNHI